MGAAGRRADTAGRGQGGMHQGLARGDGGGEGAGWYEFRGRVSCVKGWVVRVKGQGGWCEARSHIREVFGKC